MLKHPQIDPVLIEIGPAAIHWYGLMYIFGFVSFYFLALYRAKKNQFWNENKINDFMFYAIIGVIIGGRIAYVLFYDFQSFIHNPLVLFYIWQGGMSFHGGLIGVIFAIYYFARKFKQNFYFISDFICPFVAPGLFFGRIGNFINSELWGKATDLPWAMIAPWGNYEAIPRHPSQLYQAFLEGIVLFVIIWIYSGLKPPIKAVSGLFLLLYGLFRFLVEFVRLPDNHIGYLFNTDWLTMGQILSLPLIIFGCILMISAYHSRDKFFKL